MKKTGRPPQALLMANGHFAKQISATHARSRSLQNMNTKIKFSDSNGKSDKHECGKRPLKMWFFRGLTQVSAP